MSSKKVATKETKAAEKKPAAKKTATASAAKKPATKPVEKEVPKAAKSAAKETASKTASKSAAKPAAKAAEKVEKVEKAAPAKAKAAAKAAESAPAKASKASAKETKASKAAAKETPKAEEKVAEKAPAKTAKAAVKEAPKAEEKAHAKTAKVEVKEEKVEVKVEPKAESKVDSKYDYAVLLEGVKKLSKSVMFVEIDEQEDRSNKKKMSSEMKSLEMKPTAAIRHKASLAEETQEELTERILKELEEQNLAFEREAASQMCTRCNRNLVSPEFWVDKHLGYCEECAFILKLGQSKEARKVEYQLGGMGDSLDEEDEDIMGPDADDLKAAEDDLADLDD
ncbi:MULTISPECIES: hypothetical protein [unclassified Fibrobacter]|uniref:hypothetical protein n=1 Tax=unclassified Fibrobacter TaxID=2634177 RepID=UPI000912419F|nr:MULTISPECIES: hypothetical protein [Fibrobacter]MCL4103085.1 hypothetical protein [Fibrobacter succinogenes]MDO4948068.1 hypothetical protein [Fibrobacter sp.]SHL26917.1 hypothetical protein SAMN05720765_11230 [Fibrobacter sp. UWH6]SHL71761.1 hypothetical protein SAMN05720764_12136 [Fibrobacter sp. UWH5]